MSALSLRLPFTAFEIEVLKLLMMSPSQFHYTRWAYVKVYHYWYEYLKGKPFVIFFLHLFRFGCSPVAQEHSKRLIYFELTVCGFRFLPKQQPYEDRYFLVILIGSEAHATICVVEDRVERRCVELFLKYWTKSHFSDGGSVYIYKEEDLLDEALYQKNQMTSFINDMSYLICVYSN